MIGGLVLNLSAFSQISETVSQIRGNYQFDGQYYNADTTIGAPIVPQKVLANGFMNLNYTRGNFTAGIRYEHYLDVLQGFDKRYKGTGIPYRFARYTHKNIDITVGNFYEQFGSGMILRIYEERGLLYDNTLEGSRVIYNPYKGITLKGLIGRQRTFFSFSPGTVRGFDGEININELLDSAMVNCKTRIIVGGSFVSKYQKDEDPSLVLPENVGCYGGRININRGDFNFTSEGAYKINDPGGANKNSYKDGKAFYVSTSYAMKGFSFLLAGKMIDNFMYRSDRNATGQAAIINFLPALTKAHTYLLPAYNPYATQPNGELGAMAEMQFKIPKKSKLGGTYGMDILLNYSMAHGTDTTYLVAADDNRQYVYSVDYAKMGDKYFHDFTLEMTKKFSKKLKGTFLYSNQFYNKNIVQFNAENAGYKNVNSNIFVLDVSHFYKSGSSIRYEFQTLQTKQDKGSWVTGLIEWTPMSNFYIAVLDQYNYGNSIEKERFHYPLVSMGITKESTKITLQYGKQRQGIFCVGGVCRNVPASNGLSLTITSSF